MKKLWFALCNGEPILNSFDEKKLYEKIVDFIIDFWGEKDFEEALADYGFVGEHDLLTSLYDTKDYSLLEDYDIRVYSMYLEEKN